MPLCDGCVRESTLRGRGRGRGDRDRGRVRGDHARGDHDYCEIAFFDLSALRSVRVFWVRGLLPAGWGMVIQVIWNQIIANLSCLFDRKYPWLIC